MITSLDLVTFGGGLSKYKIAAKRLGRQATRSERFESISVLVPKDLDHSFREMHRSILRPDSRGFGYWVWKPHIISSALRGNGSEFLLYLDAGCTINLDSRSAQNRLEEYIEFAAEHAIFSFSMPEQLEIRRTKQDLLRHLDISREDQVSGQRTGGVILFRRCARSMELVEEWNRIATMDNYHFIDDSPSHTPEDPQFIEHRHDQSILSCLLKKERIPGVTDETYFPRCWFEKGIDFPIWVTRHFGLTDLRRKSNPLLRTIEASMNRSEKVIRRGFRVNR